MIRYRLTLEYDGSAFHGWQKQHNAFSVQQALEESLHAFTQLRSPLVAAGRTDSGVHALGQVVHADLAWDRGTDRLADALNAHLKRWPLRVIHAAPTSFDFHARHSAQARFYRYHILTRRAAAPLKQGRAWHLPATLDIEAMRASTHYLLGHHDFSSFRGRFCVACSPKRTLDQLDVTPIDDEIHIEAKARSFLQRQVRIMVGSLARVGQGYWSPETIAKILHARERRYAGPTAPAHGLYLVGVDYPAELIEAK